MEEARVEELAYHVGEPARGVEVVHVGEPVRIDLGHERRGGREVLEIVDLEEHARRPRHGGEVDDEVRGPARGHEPHDPVHEGAFVEDAGDGAVVVAERRDLERALISIWLVFAVP